MTQSPIFDDYARYYDLLYQDKNYQIEADYVTGLIWRFNSKAGSILELGSGTGIHANLLAEKGFTIHGVERSPEMLARSIALSKNNMNWGKDRLTFSQGDICSIRLNSKFDVAVSLFHVISYQTTNNDVLAAFQTAREHLNSGGLFIFDVWYGPAVLTDRPVIRIKRMANDEIEVTRLAEPLLHPNENLVAVNYHMSVRDLQSGQVKELKETHVMRYFFKPEIELISDRTGFRLIHSEEWLTGNPAGEATWGVCFCIQAK